MDVEMQAIRRNGSDGAAHSCNEWVTGNGGGVACRIPDATENHSLLSEQITSVCRKSRERVKLGLIVFFIFVFICAVIVISLVVCSAFHEDVDDNFDSSLFKVPRSFNGSFRLPNQTFTEELFSLSSNESQALTAGLQDKLADLYTTSPALGRYFSGVEIHAFRNGSVVADYQLTFLMPEEQQDQLRNITLSREMVYNVFRQFLYDQEADESGQMYVDPASLNMFLRH
ncbi:TPA-induced transmembrane protein-like isoform X2 [Pseudoliparis swirei]|uniref:TPA-induced transmembrane protein-like isoform X2 n=1 Tax=Pseudoliparis swirei TaxID=2059687 RepID=UPI0024BEB8D0|nr:TPA-induced transmembrane protein-like isoform X2 [Pseudoliparis swirei]